MFWLATVHLSCGLGPAAIHKSENKFGLHKSENKFGLHKSENNLAKLKK